MSKRRKVPGTFLFLVITLFIPHPAHAVEGASSSTDSSAAVYFSHGLKSKQEGRTLMAERLFRKALEFEPDNADFRFELGNLYLEKNDLHSARMELEQATMINPQHVSALFNLGLVYRELGMMSEARHVFRQVLDLDSHNVKAVLQIGYTYQAEGFVEEARGWFQRARDMDMSASEPRLALEDLDEEERNARLRSQQSLQESLLRSRQFLFLARQEEELREGNENQ